MATHFIVSADPDGLVAICGHKVSTQDADSAKVGIYGQICKQCETKVKESWITIK